MTTIVHRETYHGLIRTAGDAIKILQRVHFSFLPLCLYPLNKYEKLLIRSGSVFVQEKTGRFFPWTDNFKWSRLHIFNRFIIYRQLEEEFQDAIDKFKVDGLIKFFFNLCIERKEYRLIGYISINDYWNGFLISNQAESRTKYEQLLTDIIDYNLSLDIRSLEYKTDELFML